MYKKISVLVFLWVFSSLSVLAQKPELTIITEEWPPYNYQENGKIKGFSTEIVQEIIKNLNLKYKIQILPAARLHSLINEEAYIMSFSLFRTKERENKYKWIGPISQEAIYFFKKKGNPLNIQTIEDAKKVNLITTLHKSLVYNSLLNQGFKNIDTSVDSLIIIKKVIKSRVDLGISLTNLGIKYQLGKANFPLDSLEVTPVKLLDFSLYIACSKNIPDKVIHQWQNALDEIKASGTYHKIFNKYMK